MLDAGDLDRRLTFRSVTTTRNAANEPVETWADLLTVWASKRDISDGERYAAQQVGAVVTARFQVRYTSEIEDVDPAWRVRCEGREYEIVAVKEIGRREGLEISASARKD